MNVNADRKYTSFKSFYPFYLSQHANPVSRKLHYLGTALVIGLLIWVLVNRHWQMLFLLPLLGFGVNVVFLAIFLRALLQLVGWTETRLDSVRFLALAGLLSVALGLVLMAQALV